MAKIAPRSCPDQAFATGEGDYASQPLIFPTRGLRPAELVPMALPNDLFKLWKKL